MGEHSQKGQSELTNNQVTEKVSALIPDFSASYFYYENVDRIIQHISPSQEGESENDTQLLNRCNWVLNVEGG